MQIGKAVRIARKEAGLSQEGLARRADMSLNGLALLERGASAAPRISTIEAIAGALGLTPQELFDLADDEEEAAPYTPIPLPFDPEAIAAKVREDNPGVDAKTERELLDEAFAREVEEKVPEEERELWERRLAKAVRRLSRDPKDTAELLRIIEARRAFHVLSQRVL